LVFDPAADNLSLNSVVQNLHSF